MSGRTARVDLLPYEDGWRRAIESRVRSAGRVQDRWISLSDEEWDAELDIIRGMTPSEFVTFVKAEFGMLDMGRVKRRSRRLPAVFFFFVRTAQNPAPLRDRKLK